MKPEYEFDGAARLEMEFLQDHKLAQLTNELRDIAIEYRDAQQLRQRIANKLREYLK